MQCRFLPKHSFDGLQRLNYSALCNTKIVHLYSELLDTTSDVNSPRNKGFTEWCGTHHGLNVSFSWDWTRLDDGTMSENFDYPLRTNLMLVNDKGYDIGRMETDTVVMGFIKQYPWKEVVSLALNDRGHEFKVVDRRKVIDRRASYLV